jgi:hypothetical protein
MRSARRCRFSQSSAVREVVCATGPAGFAYVSEAAVRRCVFMLSCCCSRSRRRRGDRRHHHLSKRCADGRTFRSTGSLKALGRIEFAGSGDLHRHRTESRRRDARWPRAVLFGSPCFGRSSEGMDPAVEVPIGAVGRCWRLTGRRDPATIDHRLRLQGRPAHEDEYPRLGRLGDRRPIRCPDRCSRDVAAARQDRISVEIR